MPALAPARTSGTAGMLPALKSAPVFHPSLVGFSVLTGMKGNCDSMTGKYTSPVTGLKAIGCLECAPPGPGATTAGLPLLS